MPATAAPSVQELYRLLNLYDLPEYVKEASASSIVADETTPDHVFADAIRQEYPCHTPAATLLSAAGYLEKHAGQGKGTTIYSRIVKSAEYFGVKKDLERLEQQIQCAHSKRAEDQYPDDDFAIIWEDEHGRKHRHCPLRNALEVKTAADWFVRERRNMPLEDRQTIAAKLLEKAEKYGADIKQHSELLYRTVGRGVCSAKVAADFLASRFHPKMPEEVRNGLQRIVDDIRSRKYGSTLQHSHLQKVAEVIDDLDWSYGFHTKYGKDMSLPEDVLFEITEAKVAEQTAEIIGSPLTGNFYKASDLQRLSPELLNEVEEGLGDEVREAGAFVSAEKLASVIPTLPRSTAEVLDAVLAEQGIKPIITKTAADAGIPAEVLDALAKQFEKTAPPAGSLWQHLT